MVAPLLLVVPESLNMQPTDTNRIEFHPLTDSDESVLNALNHAPGVMTFLDWQPPSVDYLHTVFIPHHLQIAEAHPGYGLWLATFKPTGDCIGWFALRPDHPDDGDAQIGYRLFPEFWGLGLATEGALELLRYAFADLYPSRCVAITMAVNLPSRNVMERIGLRHMRTFHQHFDDPLPGTEQGEVEYALTRDDWLLRRS